MSYYWRAVRRIAKKKGITISKARRLDWQKEVNAERKRRSSQSKVHPTSKRSRRTVPVPSTPLRKKVRTAVPSFRTKPGSIPRRVRTASKGKTKVPARTPTPKLKIREYERLRAKDEEEYDDIEGFEEQWSADWEEDYPDLDYLDNLVDFLDEFEYEDSDKYKEPA
jgi:hypothetical protein